jgi:Spy/CpxP family protein refolding chaperone
MLNRSKLWAFGLLFAAFAAGIATGAGAHAATEGGRREPRPSYVDRLTRDLSLTAPQRDTVVQILEAYDAAMHELWSEVRPRVDGIRLDVRGRIMTVLTPAQQEQFQELTRRRDSIRGAREADHGKR